mgnify:FL=1|tara:strand:- start:10051 stop:10488 length:438 start_codon:yes stop_codon:yes gene_type:complete
MNLVALLSKNINPYELIRSYESKNCDLSLSGAQSLFIGYMRKTNDKRDDVSSMTLEFYPEMTQGYLDNLAKIVKEKNNLDNVLIVHRIGNVKIGDCLVIVACWSKHRKECIDGVKYILEDLKHNAPFWKKEYYSDESSKWVEKNT